MALWLAMIGDTLVMRPVPPTTFQMVTGVASGIASIVLCLVVLAVIPAALYLRAQVRKASESLAKATANVEPVLKEASALLVDLRAIATSARADATTIHQAVVQADEGMQLLRRRVQTRLAEIDAVIEIVQQEVEDVFVSTAAVARGVRAGAAALVHHQNGARPNEATDLSVGVPQHGDDHTRETQPGRARPRIRSRRA
ncbi:MAG TPA: hypothetical protein VNW46_13675 [Gemmatimonadaceae bacterium]|jgi:hypothetical protein|nr:hypothetical protein [Gemmatimonadaceae bacterium]